MKSLLENLTKKISGPNKFTGEVYKIFKEETPTLHSIFIYQKTEEKEIYPNLFYEVRICCDIKNQIDIIRKKYRTIFLKKHKCKK